MALHSDPGALFGVGMLVVGGIVALVSLRYTRRTTRVVRAPAVASLAGTAPGTVVRVDGTAVDEARHSIVAPFSGRDSIAVEASVEERRLSPVVLPWDVTVWETQRAVPSRVRTPESEIAVASPGHTVVLEADDVSTTGFEEDPPDRIAAFEAETDDLPRRTVWRDPLRRLAALWRLLGLGTRRYSEAALEAGDDVTVVGRRREGGTVDPIVLSDRSARRTFYRMARTALVGLAVGALGLALGAALLVV